MPGNCHCLSRKIRKGKFFESSLWSSPLLAGSLPSANAWGVFVDYGSFRMWRSSCGWECKIRDFTVVGRKTVSKEQKMRDVRYRVVVCTEFSDLSIFSFSDAYSFDISARVHVASKYIQTTDLQRRGRGDGEETYLEHVWMGHGGAQKKINQKCFKHVLVKNVFKIISKFILSHRGR